MLSEREKLIRNILQERLQLTANSDLINISLEIKQSIIDQISNDLYKHATQTYLLVIGRYGIQTDIYYRLMEVRLANWNEQLNSGGPYLTFNRTQFRDINIDMICE